jgi:hypothetical protein
MKSTFFNQGMLPRSKFIPWITGRHVALPRSIDPLRKVIAAAKDQSVVANRNHQNLNHNPGCISKAGLP